MTRRGRKGTKLTPAVHDAIIESVTTGVHPEQAVRQFVSRSTYFEWQSRAREGVEPYAELFDEIERAEAKCEVLLTKAVVKGAKKDWRAAAEQRTKRFPDRWGDRITIEMREKLQETAVDKVLDVLRERLDPETYGRVVAALDREDGQPEDVARRVEYAYGLDLSPAAADEELH